MREALRNHAWAGKPIYGECGGLMYLSDAIVDLHDETFSMLGLISGKAVMQSNLQALLRAAIRTSASAAVRCGTISWLETRSKLSRTRFSVNGLSRQPDAEREPQAAVQHMPEREFPEQKPHELRHRQRDEADHKRVHVLDGNALDGSLHALLVASAGLVPGLHACSLRRIQLELSSNALYTIGVATSVSASDNVWPPMMPTAIARFVAAPDRMRSPAATCQPRKPAWSSGSDASDRDTLARQLRPAGSDPLAGSSSS